MLIDCDACAVRGPACGDCVVSVLLSGPATSGHQGHAGHAGHQGHPGHPGHPGGPGTAATDAPGTTAPATTAELDEAERAAIAVLAGCGLVPPLRLVPVEIVRPPHAPRGPIAESEREVS